MSQVSIRNQSADPATLPWPLRGSLKGGQLIVLDVTKAALVALCPGIDLAFKVSSSDSTGPFDATYGPTGDDVATTGAAGLESAADKTALDAAASYLSTANKTRLDRKQRGFLGVNAQTGTGYAPVLADAGKLVTLTNAGAISVPIPLVATAAWEVGDTLEFIVGDAGAATFACAGGTITPSAGKTLVSLGAGARVQAVMTAVDVWYVSGDLVAAV